MASRPGADDRRVQPPAHDAGEHDGGRVDRDARAQPALEQEKARAEQAGFRVEAAAEIFVGGVDVQPPVNRQEKRRDEDQREGRAEIVLHEAETVFIPLSGHGKERDRAGLRGHDRQADGEPARVATALEVGLEVALSARAPDPVGGDAHQRGEQDEVVERVHGAAG